MFRGLAALNIDSKGRMAIPTRYRDSLVRHCNGQMVITVDRDHCLLLYPLPDWEEIERKLVRLPGFNKQARRMQRLLIGHATECEMDGNGRVLLPPALREFARLDKSVVLIGQGNKFEVWAEEAWAARRAEWLSAADDDDGELSGELGSLSL